MVGKMVEKMIILKAKKMLDDNPEVQKIVFSKDGMRVYTKHKEFFMSKEEIFSSNELKNHEAYQLVSSLGIDINSLFEKDLVIDRNNFVETVKKLKK